MFDCPISAIKFKGAEPLRRDFILEGPNPLLSVHICICSMSVFDHVSLNLSLPPQHDYATFMFRNISRFSICLYSILSTTDNVNSVLNWNTIPNVHIPVYPHRMDCSESFFPFFYSNFMCSLKTRIVLRNEFHFISYTFIIP